MVDAVPHRVARRGRGVVEEDAAHDDGRQRGHPRAEHRGGLGDGGGAARDRDPVREEVAQLELVLLVRREAHDVEHGVAGGVARLRAVPRDVAAVARALA
eukprot:430958-Rhodomonas_salina.1